MAGGGGGGGSPSPVAASAAPVQVRCAGCRGVLAVAPGMTEFICPKCRMAQRLPPELMPPSPPKASPTPPPQPQPHPQLQPPPPPAPLPPPSRRSAPRAQGVDPTKIQLPCARCKAILNVPHGLARFRCPQCDVDLAVDLSKLRNFLATAGPGFAPPLPLPPPPPPPMPPIPLPHMPFLPMMPHVPVPMPPMASPAELPEEINEVAVDVEREEDEGGTVGETFMDYRPPKLSLGLPHPDPVVETSSLSAVQPPEPTYDLTIMDELDETKVLSCLQIETIVYASQRHLYHLPTGARAGFFIGDGAGVGKGRTIAGLIWENWKQGRHKALWISIGSDLKYDARRDLDDVGAKYVEVHALNKLPYSKIDSKAVGITTGVIFVTYSSLIASSEKGRSRLQQLIEWCGSEFDGLLVFDECHKAKNLIPEAGSQPTRTGKAVLEIQEMLPEARVVYCSATGASEPRNLGYMVRLGLWGDGTSFQNFQKFLGALEKGGVGALELVAMDMKARGMYVCRTLSYKGAAFATVEAPLEERMMNMYRKAAEFWAELRVELLSAIEYYAEDKGNSSQIWRLYWASHQRFFRHMCMSAKVPAVVRLVKEALAEEKCVVIGLQSTGEARTEEAISKYGVEMEDFVSGPRELLLKLVDDNYPLPPKPDCFQQVGDEKVAEVQRKRHYGPDVCFKGQARKLAKMEDESDDGTDEYSLLNSWIDILGKEELPEVAKDSSVTSGRSRVLSRDASRGSRRRQRSCSTMAGCDVAADAVRKELSISGDGGLESVDGKDNKQRVRDPTLLVDRAGSATGRRGGGGLTLIGKADPGDGLGNDDGWLSFEKFSSSIHILMQWGLPITSMSMVYVHTHSLLLESYTTPVKSQRETESDHESTESEEEFNMCQICNTEELNAILGEDDVAPLYWLRRTCSPWLSDSSLDWYDTAVERKSNILQIIRSLDLPNNPLDDIIDQLGGPYNVAEITGRRGMLVRASDGKGVVYQTRNKKEVALDMINIHEKQQFMDGEKLVAIISEAGSADRAIQQFGRTHRSNQNSAPEYRLLFTNLGGEKRFASIVAKRLESLGALTQGDRRAGPSLSAFNYDSTYGKKALMMMYRGILEQDGLPVLPSGCSEDQASLQGFITKAKAALVSVGIIRDALMCWLWSVLKLFDLFTSILDIVIQNARSEGQLDSGIVDIKAKSVKMKESPKTVHVDSLSGASTVLFTFTIDRGFTWESANAILEERQKDGAGYSDVGFYESRREWMGRRHYMLAFEGSTEGMYRVIRPAVGEALREMPLVELKSKYRKVSSIDKIGNGWQEEYDASSKQCMHGPKCKLGSYCTVGRRLQEINILGGLILPVWGIVEKALAKQVRQIHKRIRVARLETNDNERIVGLMIPNSAVESVLEGLQWVQDIDD
uniref:Sno protein n=1 Tax=Oryza sativa subsp. japonica TaxID=39947 RepID=Q7F1V5_ORYSJ|nr:putative sno protein [Oryza sativa Japonica Group]